MQQYSSVSIEEYASNTKPNQGSSVVFTAQQWTW